MAAPKQYGSDPGTYHYAVTPANTPMPPIPRALYVQAAGNLVVTDPANTTITYAVTAGSTFPFRTYIVATGTTANVVAWY